METTESVAVFALQEQMRLHTRQFNNALAGINLGDEKKRINDNTNHITWLAGTLVSVRYYLAEIVGINVNDPYAHLFRHGKALNASYDYPALDVLKKDWEPVSEQLLSKLSQLTFEELKQMMPQDSPMKQRTVFDALIFLVDRESYIIGQIAFIRRIFGYEAMKYN